MNVSRTREAVWAVAFVQRWRDDPQVIPQARAFLARDCAKYADLAVELFDLAVEPKGEAVEEGRRR